MVLPDVVLPQPTIPDLPPPRPALEASVVIPARDEEALLPRALRALAGQRTEAGRPLDPECYEVIVVANNCTDGTAEAARAVGRALGLRLWVAEATFPPERATVGAARRLGMNTAAARLAAVGWLGGTVLSTDADTEPAPDWIAATLGEIARGADGVGGRVVLRAEERAALPAPVRRSYLLDLGYHRWVEELHGLLDPDPHDPFPRHHQHGGASFAVTAEAYARAGGLPALAHAEDVALFEAVQRVGGRFRHSFCVRAATSARRHGRAPLGLAHGLGAWTAEARAHGEHHLWVEAAAAVERRLALRGRVRRLWLRQASAPGPEVEALARRLGVDRRDLADVLRAAPTAGAAQAWAEQRRAQRDGPPPFEPVEAALWALRRRVDGLRRAASRAPCDLPASCDPPPPHSPAASCPPPPRQPALR